MPKWTTEYLYSVTAKSDNPDNAAAVVVNIHNADIAALEAEIAELRGYRNRWEASEATINEAIRLRDRAYGDRDHWRALFAAANATLDKLREVVPDIYDTRRFCHKCKRLVDTCVHPDYAGEFCIECDNEVYHLSGDDDVFHDVLAAILYPSRPLQPLADSIVPPEPEFDAVSEAIIMEGETPDDHE